MKTIAAGQQVAKMVAVFAALAATAVTLAIGGNAQAAPARKNVVIKVEPMRMAPEEAEKKQEDRMNAVNRALEQSLNEQAKSQSEYRRHGDTRSQIDTRENRAEMNRELREESRREKRLNWLND